MNKKYLAAVIIGGIVLLGLGFVAGFLIEKQRAASQMREREENLKISEQKIKAIAGLSSKVMSSVLAYGEVARISGRTVFLNYMGENLEITIGENAKISSLKKGPSEESNFSDIKKGDRLNVSVKVNVDGQLEALSVIILPNPTP